MLRRNPYLTAVSWVVASTLGGWLAGTLLMPPPPGVPDPRRAVLSGLFAEPAALAALIAIPQGVVLGLLFRPRGTVTAALWVAVTVVTTWVAFFAALFSGFLGLVVVAVVASPFDTTTGLTGRLRSSADLGAAGLVLAAIPFLFGCVAAGVCVGVPQALVLRLHLRRVRWWLLATMVGSFPLAPLIWATLYQEVTMSGTWPGTFLGLAGGAGYGIVTGAALAWLADRLPP